MELVLLDGSDRRFAIEDASELMIGAAAHCAVRLNAVDVSRSHALISCQRGKILLLDLGSTNGTFVNGKRVRDAELTAGDTIRFSSVVAQVMPPATEDERSGDLAADGGQERGAERPAKPDLKSPTSDRAPALMHESLNWLLDRWGSENEAALSVFVEWLVGKRGLCGAAVLEDVGGEIGVAAAHGDVGDILEDPGCVALVRNQLQAVDSVEEMELTLGQRRVVAVRAPGVPLLLVIPANANPDSSEIALLVRLLAVAKRIDAREHLTKK